MTTPDALRPKFHELKCWPDPFEAMQRGEKTAEFRLNDRGFREGDTLLIREWCPVSGHYTGAELRRTITHVLDAGFGLPDGYVMLSLNRVDGDTDFGCPYWSGAYWKGYEAFRAGQSAAKTEAEARVKVLEEVLRQSAIAIRMQADCLPGYFPETRTGAVPTVAEIQRSHFNDIAADMEAAIGGRDAA